MSAEPSTSKVGEAAHWPALDGVRGLAFVLVALFHANDYLGRRFFLADGQVGVWLFFVLSSYLLSRALLARPAELQRGSTWARYAIRRVLRIFPLFGVYLFGLWYFAHVPLDKCLRVLTLQTTHGVDWSLFVECRFYLVLPVLVLPAAFLRRGWWYPAFLAAGLAVAVWWFPPWRDFTTWPWAGARLHGAVGNGVFLSYLSCFLPGVIAAYSSLRWPLPAARAAVASDTVGLVVLLALPLIPVLAPQGDPAYAARYARLVHLWFPYACLFAVWVYLLGHGQGVFARVLASRPARLLGAISYPGYLVHLFVLHLLRPHVESDGLYLLIGLPLVCVVSYALHLTVERPLCRVWREPAQGQAAESMKSGLT